MADIHNPSDLNAVRNDRGGASERPSVADVLIAARKLIEKPEKWTKGCWARNAAGKECPSLSPAAICWCARGAIRVASNQYRIVASRAERILRGVIEEDNSGGIAKFNDEPERVHAEILSAFDYAIESARTGAAS